jgi:hypothetical protein
LWASKDKSSTYIRIARLCPTSFGSTAVAITTGLRPYGATPSRKIAERVAIRWSVARPNSNPPPMDDPWSTEIEKIDALHIRSRRHPLPYTPCALIHQGGSDDAFLS